MPFRYAAIFARAHAHVENSIVTMSVGRAGAVRTATGIRARVAQGGGDPAQVGASATAESWGVSFVRSAASALEGVPLRTWADGTVRVTEGPSDVPALTIQKASEQEGIVHLECSARGRGKALPR